MGTLMISWSVSSRFFFEDGQDSLPETRQKDGDEHHTTVLRRLDVVNQESSLDDNQDIGQNVGASDEIAPCQLLRIAVSKSPTSIATHKEGRDIPS